MILPRLGEAFGWTVSRAPDVLYGDEMSFPEGIVLFLVATALWRGNRRTHIFAAVMALINGTAGAFDVWSLQKPFAFSWTAIWISVFLVASWPSTKAYFMRSRGVGKSA